MNYIEKIDSSIEDILQTNVETILIELSIHLYRRYLESGKKKQHCLLLTDCNNEEIIHLCYRADSTYFSYFKTHRDILIGKCHKKGVSISLTKTSYGNELFPHGDVETSKYLTVYCEERQKLSLKVAQIECIELHPLIQRKGIFTKIVEGLLAIESTHSVIVTNIYNKQWFDCLRKNATETAVISRSRAALFVPTYSN